MTNQEKLELTVKRVKFFDKIRIIALILAVAPLAITWLLGKGYDGVAWYESLYNGVLKFVFVAVIVVVISTFVKFFYFNKYKILKMKMK